MNGNTKKWINRGGFLAMALGVILIMVAGGDTGAAIANVGIVAEIAGALLVLLREIFN